MNSHYTYFLILAASLAGPLALSFDKKVSFYRKWKYVFPSMVIPAALYIAWDIFFTSRGVWHFNEKYISGIHFINLPLEEVLFFFVVPYCCLFIYECIRSYFPLLRNSRQAGHLLLLLGAAMLLTGILYSGRYYTSWTFIFNALFISALFLFKNFFRNFDALSFLVAYAVCLLPFMVVNGYLTAIPVVLYNDAENLGIRLYTIPFEDIFYGMLLVMMNVAIFERLRSRPA